MAINVWHPSQHSKTTVATHDAAEARDIFCRRYGYVDHADYCQRNALIESNLHTELVGQPTRPAASA
ncbi:hypothetical protein [Dyella ginsengisoli]|uniref:hypothetical protein n=1 Tax=Dyella ginsengisoli TaxID=363848 RepID=UPI000348756B|nr:hypothetical protein [Dyella ginsengisoli]